MGDLSINLFVVERESLGFILVVKYLLVCSRMRGLSIVRTAVERKKHVLFVKIFLERCPKAQKEFDELMLILGF